MWPKTHRSAIKTSTTGQWPHRLHLEVEKLFPISDRLPSGPLILRAAIVPVFDCLTGNFNRVTCELDQVRKGLRRSQAPLCMMLSDSSRSGGIIIVVQTQTL